MLTTRKIVRRNNYSFYNKIGQSHIGLALKIYKTVMKLLNTKHNFKLKYTTRSHNIYITD